jgi:hypothetical protein
MIRKMSGFKSWLYENDIKWGWKLTRTQMQIREKHYFGLTVTGKKGRIIEYHWTLKDIGRKHSQVDL